ncbi:MAG: hypothetical protein GY870_15775 [archaeon]|nr:hypothetical protein [archaeon]
MRGHITKTPVLKTDDTITGVVSPGVGNQLIMKLKELSIDTYNIIAIKEKVIEIIDVIMIR